MAEPFIGEIRIFAGGVFPRGWAPCDGRLLPIAAFQALFSILGTTYGGDGIRSFALPNLQGAVPMHVGPGFALGQRGGEAHHALLASEIPTHTHVPVGSSNGPDSQSPTNAFWPTATSGSYAASGAATLAQQAIAIAGANQPHDNMSPFLTLNFCIALNGLFPTRS